MICANTLCCASGLRKPGTAEQVWAEASGTAGAELTAGGMASVGGAQPGEPRASSAWPIVMFMSLVVGGPYLIWKLLRSVQASLGDTPAPTQGKCICT